MEFVGNVIMITQIGHNPISCQPLRKDFALYWTLISFTSHQQNPLFVYSIIAPSVS